MTTEDLVTYALIKDLKIINVLVFDANVTQEVLNSFVEEFQADEMICLKDMEDREDWHHARIGATYSNGIFTIPEEETTPIVE